MERVSSYHPVYDVSSPHLVPVKVFPGDLFYSEGAACASVVEDGVLVLFTCRFTAGTLQDVGE